MAYSREVLAIPGNYSMRNKRRTPTGPPEGTRKGEILFLSAASHLANADRPRGDGDFSFWDHVGRKGRPRIRGGN